MHERRNTHTVGLIGTGMVGASFTYALMQRGVADELVLIDADRARAEGEMMDLNHITASTRAVSTPTSSASTATASWRCGALPTSLGCG